SAYLSAFSMVLTIFFTSSFFCSCGNKNHNWQRQRQQKYPQGLFLLFVDPKVGIISQFVAAIIVFIVIHNIVEVVVCSVVYRIRLDPWIRVVGGNVGWR